MMPSESTCCPHRAYLCIKDMTVNRANAMPSPYIAGLPSMYGVVGMAKQLVDNVLKGSGLAFDSVAISISQFSMEGSQQKHPAYSLADLKKGQDMRIITARDSHFSASVIIRVSLNHKHISDVKNWLSSHCHLDGLYQLRLCGGGIIYKSKSPQLHLFNESELSLFCKNIDGFLVADRIELCRSSKQHGEDALDTLLRLIQERKSTGQGWLVPLSVGFKPFGNRVHRENTRQKLLHGFAEPVIGLGRLFNAAASAEIIGKEDHLFWKPNPEREFLVSGSV